MRIQRFEYFFLYFSMSLMVYFRFFIAKFYFPFYSLLALKSNRLSNNFHFHLFFSFIILGVGFVLRKIGNNVAPTVELKKDGDKYKLITSSTFKNTEIVFELGKEFDETTLDGREVKSVVTLEGNTLTHKQGGTPPSTIIRVFGEKEMIATMTVNKVTCTRKYVHVADE